MNSLDLPADSVCDMHTDIDLFCALQLDRCDVAHGTQLVDHVLDMLEIIEQNSTQSRPEPDSNKEKWLIHIDDDVDLANVLRAKMEHRGIKVLNATNGVAGVRTTFRRPPSAILLDFEMPRGRGDFVLRKLKENPVTRDIPVIVLSGKGAEHIKQNMLELGAVAFVDKPYEFEDLFQKVSDAMGQSD